MSADGRFVAFASLATNLAPGDTGGFAQIYLRDRASGTTRRISVGVAGAAGDSYGVAVAGNGRYVAFGSHAGNLVDGDHNRLQDVFVRDVRLGTTRLVSVAADGRTQANAESSMRTSRICVPRWWSWSASRPPGRPSTPDPRRCR